MRASLTSLVRNSAFVVAIVVPPMGGRPAWAVRRGGNEQLLFRLMEETVIQTGLLDGPWKPTGMARANVYRTEWSTGAKHALPASLRRLQRLSEREGIAILSDRQRDLPCQPVVEESAILKRVAAEKEEEALGTKLGTDGLRGSNRERDALDFDRNRVDFPPS